MGQYKKGDYIRAVNGYYGQFTAGKVYKVSRVVGDSVSVELDDKGSTTNGWSSRNFEPWQPKVGERVRVARHVNSYGSPIHMDLPIGSVHTVSRVGDALGNKDRPSFTLSGGGVNFYLVENLEPITDPLPVAVQPAALKIRAGGYYKTRDGRKVGPMFSYSSSKGWWAVAYGDANIWLADGKHKPDCTQGSYMSEAGDLIAEWPSAAPVAATVDAINDEYGPVVPVLVAEQPARFKVGDEVISSEEGQTNGLHGVIIADDRSSVPFLVRFDGWRDGHGDGDAEWWVQEKDLVLADYTKPTTAIVALIENGQPLPATRPAVHTSAEDATKEARRLASVHKGQEFGVFVLTGATHKEAKVYEHEWQRLADQGKRADAQKELRRMSGLSEFSAASAVAHFIAA